MILRPMTTMVLACALLGGCVTVFPKGEPSALYKLSITPRPEQPVAAVKLNILRAPTTFPRVSSSDQIITVTGAEAAAIEGARWAGPAQIMFDEQIVAAFDTSPRLRLLTRGGATAPDATMRIEVRTFEARYVEAREIIPTKSAKAKAKDFDKRGPPKVVVEIRATVTYPSNSTVVMEHFFRAEVPATENRVSAIVAAYDAATTEVLTGLVGWVEALPPPAPKPALPIASPR